MSGTFRPLLASDAGKEAGCLDRHIRSAGFLLASPKIDGIRSLVLRGRLVSRNLKPIPNRFVNEYLHRGREFIEGLEGLDGELVVGDAFGDGVFKRTSSGVTSAGGEPDFRWLVFDRVSPVRYAERLAEVDAMQSEACLPRVVVVPQTEVRSVEAAMELEAGWVERGYEGMMVRRPDAPYKLGRSTINEGFLLKVKRFEDREGVVVGFEEELENTNPATRDALGRTVRSQVSANFVGKGRLGAFWLRDGGPGGAWNDFTCGSGLTAAERRDFWDRRDSLLGRAVTYKYTPVGTVDAPRFPIFKGFRDPIDA